MCEGHTTVHIILISAFSEYRPPLHVYIFNYKASTTCEYGAYTFGWSDKISGHRSLKCYIVQFYGSGGQSVFMVKKRNLPPLLSFSALLICILPHWSDKKDYHTSWKTGVVICGKPAVTWFVASTNQRHSAFLIPHFTFRILQFRTLPIAGWSTMSRNTAPAAPAPVTPLHDGVQ